MYEMLIGAIDPWYGAGIFIWHGSIFAVFLLAFKWTYQKKKTHGYIMLLLLALWCLTALLNAYLFSLLLSVSFLLTYIVLGVILLRGIKEEAV
ncbi:hypothetical protein [Halobacillus salinus]|uniref:hypothetical protein n=1 Tax=Halobacillus salinus TaxID=192814 RepID=UPI0009A86542|nr:hypothetical protein [Halobacillus salinus]